MTPKNTYPYWLWPLAAAVLFFSTTVSAHHGSDTPTDDFDALLDELGDLVFFDSDFDDDWYDDDFDDDWDYPADDFEVTDSENSFWTAPEVTAYPAAPGTGYRWEDGVVRPDGSVIDGFWRKTSEPGYLWQDSGYDAQSNWIDYGWVPLEGAPENYTWVTGYRGSDATWKMGYWRAEERAGHDWAGGYYEDDEYVSPQWLPEEVNSEELYVPGYRATTGYWIPGFRRQRTRMGYQWVNAYWDNGMYVPGYWQPTRRRTSYRWIPGHVGVDGYWVYGTWQPTARRGYSWVDGYYVADVYVWGFWRPINRRAGYHWVVGSPSGGIWRNGYWRRSRRTGFLWVPGYHQNGAYISGYWHPGHGPKPSIHRHYNRTRSRMRYHRHHVKTAHAHRGPHFRRNKSAMWQKSAVYRPRYAKASSKRRAERTKAPTRYRANAKRPLVKRTVIRSNKAGKRLSKVRVKGAQRPSVRPTSRGRRPTRNPAFVRPQRSKRPAVRRATNPPIRRTRPAGPSGAKRPSVTPRRVQPSRPSVTPRRVQPSRPSVTPRRVQPSRPSVTPRRAQPSRPSVTPRRVQPSRPSVTPRRAQPSRPSVTPRRVQPSRPSARKALPSAKRPSPNIRRATRPKAKRPERIRRKR